MNIRVDHARRVVIEGCSANSYLKAIQSYENIMGDQGFLEIQAIVIDQLNSLGVSTFDILSLPESDNGKVRVPVEITIREQEADLHFHSNSTGDTTVLPRTAQYLATYIR